MNLLKTLAAVSSMTLVSRILGFVRDTIIAHVFGAGAATDVFFTAFKLPNMLRRIFAEGAFSQAFVPTLAEYKTRKGEEETKEFIAKIAGMLTLVLVLVTLIGVLAAPAIIYFSAAGFAKNPDKFNLAVELLRYMFPYILLISLSSLVGSILNTYNRFSVPAFVPTLLNVSFIACALWLAPLMDRPIFALAIAVLIGGVAQLCYQLPHLAKLGMLMWPKLDVKDEGVWRVIKQMGPAIFGVSVAQISLIINSNLASFLASGSVSWIYYADRLMEFPTGVLGVALGTILLPSLARSHASGDQSSYDRLLDWGLRLCIMLCLPATVALAILAEPLVLTLFQGGKFSMHDALMTQQALVGYSVGLIGLILIKILAPAFYARQDIKTVVRIGIITLLATLAINLTFLYTLPFKHAGLTLGMSLGACLNAGLLYRTLRLRGYYTPQAAWKGFMLRIILGVATMSALLFVLLHFIPAFAGMHKLVRVGWLSVLVVSGASAYFAALFALGFRPKDFSRKAITD
jgi:putative peptidoglycan lipid II flippase